ncbi:MAG: Flp pilus assembly complex ATPase component TadA [Candidatus Magnetoovum sp. WYHC-5]|nr:Flp pilus assembly complex ATPase component TadA [Candidatus Magnetoovum sp. WYHC-5]
MAKKKLGEILKEKGYVTDEKFEVAMTQQKITGVLLGETLQKLGFVSAKEMAQTLAEQSDMEYLNLSEYSIPSDVLKLVPQAMAQRFEFIPINKDNGYFKIGIINPGNVVAIDAATKTVNMQVKPVMVDKDSYLDKVEKAYYFLEHPIVKQIDSTIKEISETPTPQPATITRLTDLILQDGIRRNATDIHINPAEDVVNVFYRVDGVLQLGMCFTRTAQNGVISRIKILSSLDIAEQRLPQDGYFSYTFLRKSYEMRVSTVPSIYGENTVLRVLSGSGTLMRFETLGFDATDTKKLKNIFKNPYGIILITGPTGSGKTTTLYSALREVNLLQKNVLTVEDPVEYRLSFVKQTQVNMKAGYDFALAGRNFMRQDPDVMLLGEIRDEKTATIAVRAAITGHLVLSTLHTNDAITAIPRLIDMGVDRFNVAASVAGIVAQRLLRKLCVHCKKTYELPPYEIEYLKLCGLKGELPTTGVTSSGCHACNNTGYMGRTVIGEILIIDDDLRELISSSASFVHMKKVAIEKGMVTMQLNAISKFLLGITSIEEIQRVAG